jgi:hypothetical protein
MNHVCSIEEKFVVMELAQKPLRVPILHFVMSLCGQLVDVNTL